MKTILLTILLCIVACVIIWILGYTPDRYSIGYVDGYQRASVDIKIFVSGTGRLPGDEWANRAAKYRLTKKEIPGEGIELGLLPDAKTTLQPFAVSENK